MLGFFVAVIAGYMTPQITEKLADPVIRTVARYITIAPAERPLVGWFLALLAAGVAAELLESGSPFWVVFGGVLGYFGKRIVAAAQKFINTGSNKY
ncbi:hypothetical protein [Yoonia sp.]|uniref:hypothetical protein n=1 Tax=Yoonia sp. TaxID=2212373 RepID=UPI001A0998CD|nr:hypothetical protein [Yoonia sp.]MBE0413011.1 hypothetical protein [Yoonia sp.]